MGCSLEPSDELPGSDSSDLDEDEGGISVSPPSWNDAVGCVTTTTLLSHDATVRFQPKHLFLRSPERPVNPLSQKLHSRDLVDTVLLASFLWMEEHYTTKLERLRAPEDAPATGQAKGGRKGRTGSFDKGQRGRLEDDDDGIRKALSSSQSRGRTSDSTIPKSKSRSKSSKPGSRRSCLVQQSSLFPCSR